MQENLTSKIKNCAYPGRGLVQGISEDSKSAFQVYWIMGRSENSRNRVFEVENGKLSTQAADPALCEDPSLVIYDAMLEAGASYIVSNGDQTTTIQAFLNDDKSFKAALDTREREPDAPNYTPRISGMVQKSDEQLEFLFSILKANKVNPELSDRHYFSKSQVAPGTGLALTTYIGDGNPLPSFCGEPFELPLQGTAEDILNLYWDTLNEDNKISLAIKTIDLASGNSSILIKNKYTKKG